MKCTILFFLSLLSLGACVSRSPSSVWKPEQVRRRKVILFVPGLYGSALKDADTDSRVFQTGPQALWGKIPLALAGKELGIAGARRLVPDGLLEDVIVVPGLYAVDAYGGSVRYLRDRFGERAQVLSFFYDWRDDDVKAVQALGRQVRALRAAGATSIALVGHSLGAALAAFYLRYGEQSIDGNGPVENWEGTRHVDAAVLAALPYRGSLNAFYDLLHGTAVGLAKTPLSAVSLGSFPSFYQFLPPAESGMFLDSKSRSIGEEVYRSANWRTWKAGLFQDTEGVSPDTLGARERYTARFLAHGRRFSSLMRAPASAPASRRIPVLAVTGTGFTTLSTAILEDRGTWRFSGTHEDGDGLVTVTSASPPEAFERNLAIEKIALPMEHRGMFTRKELQDPVSAFLTRHGF